MLITKWLKVSASFRLDSEYNHVKQDSLECLFLKYVYNQGNSTELHFSFPDPCLCTWNTENNSYSSWTSEGSSNCINALCYKLSQNQGLPTVNLMFITVL